MVVTKRRYFFIVLILLILFALAMSISPFVWVSSQPVIEPFRLGSIFRKIRNTVNTGISEAQRLANETEKKAKDLEKQAENSLQTLANDLLKMGLGDLLPLTQQLKADLQKIPDGLDSLNQKVIDANNKLKGQPSNNNVPINKVQPPLPPVF